MKRKNTGSSFLSGYGGLLTLFPAAHHGRFVYRGHNLIGLTTSEALASDWSMVGQDLYSAMLKEDHVQAEKEQEQQEQQERELTYR